MGANRASLRLIACGGVSETWGSERERATSIAHDKCCECVTTTVGMKANNRPAVQRNKMREKKRIFLQKRRVGSWWRLAGGQRAARESGVCEVAVGHQCSNTMKAVTKSA